VIDPTDGIQEGAWSEEESRLRIGICRVGKLAYERGFIAAADGNISARMADGTILITATGAMKGFLQPHHLAHINMQGEVIDDGPQCSSETGIHLAVYEQRPEMHAVFHAHPPHAVAMTVAGVDLQMPIIPEIVVTIGGIPTAPYATPGTHELADSIRDLIGCTDTLLMKNHGSVSIGSNLMDAYKKLDMLEHTSKILYLAHTVKGGLDPLPPEQVRKLLETRRMLGITTTNTLETRCGL
jgi:L-fuculose-phosphate aldolase